MLPLYGNRWKESIYPFADGIYDFMIFRPELIQEHLEEVPCGVFHQYDEILSASELADGPDHNSAFCLSGVWYTADRLEIRNGRLQSVKMT